MWGDWFVGWGLSDKIAAAASVAAALQVIALIWTIWITARNGRRQLRAYVFLNTGGILDGSMLKPPQPHRVNVPGVLLTFRNAGQTPAYKVVSWAQIEINEPRNEDRLVAPALEQQFATSLGPGDTMPKPLWYQRALMTDEIADIATGAKAVYVYGRIEYRDVFKKLRYADFRLKYNGQFPPPEGVILVNCVNGNNAT